MSTWSTIHAACVDLVETASGLTRSPMPIGLDGLVDGLAPGPLGGWFTIAPDTSEYGGMVAGRADNTTAMVVSFTWSATPDPNTRIGECMDRAEAIRVVLLNESQTTIPEVRFDVGVHRWEYPSADIILCQIPFTLYQSARAT